MSGPGGSASRLRVGVAGLGYWGPNLARNFADLARIRAGLVLRSVAGGPGAGRAAFPGRARHRRSRSELLADPALDAVR